MRAFHFEWNASKVRKRNGLPTLSRLFEWDMQIRATTSTTLEQEEEVRNSTGSEIAHFVPCSAEQKLWMLIDVLIPRPATTAPSDGFFPRKNLKVETHRRLEGDLPPHNAHSTPCLLAVPLIRPPSDTILYLFIEKDYLSPLPKVGWIERERGNDVGNNKTDSRAYGSTHTLFASSNSRWGAATCEIPPRKRLTQGQVKFLAVTHGVENRDHPAPRRVVVNRVESCFPFWRTQRHKTRWWIRFLCF